MTSGQNWRGTANLAWKLSADLTQGVDLMIRLEEVMIEVTRKTSASTTIKLPPQPVRVDYDGRRVPVTPSPVESAAGAINYSDIVVLGYHNHPTITDTDLIRGDTFSLRGKRYEVDQIFSIHTDRLTAGAKEKT